MSQFILEIMVLFELAYSECSSEAVILDSLDIAVATHTHNVDKMALNHSVGNYVDQLELKNCIEKSHICDVKNSHAKFRENKPLN